MQQTFLLSLVRSHGPQLNRFFAARVADTSEAQDLVQEVYLRLLKLERPDLIRNPKAYVFRVASTVAHEHWLKRSARPPHVEWDEETDEASPSSEDLVVSFERLEQLALLLGELSPNVGAALVWAHRDGHTYEEIGARLAVSKNRVKKYLTKALAHCRGGIPEPRNDNPAGAQTGISGGEEVIAGSYVGLGAR